MIPTTPKTELEKAISEVQKGFVTKHIRTVLYAAKRVSEMEKERDGIRKLLRPIQECPQCHGAGEFPDSEEGGIPTTCDCWNATKKLLQSKLTTIEHQCDGLKLSVELLTQDIIELRAKLETAERERDEARKAHEMYAGRTYYGPSADADVKLMVEALKPFASGVNPIPWWKIKSLIGVELAKHLTGYNCKADKALSTPTAQSFLKP